MKTAFDKRISYSECSSLQGHQAAAIWGEGLISLQLAVTLTLRFSCDLKQLGCFSAPPTPTPETWEPWPQLFKAVTAMFWMQWTHQRRRLRRAMSHGGVGHVPGSSVVKNPPVTRGVMGLVWEDPTCLGAAKHHNDWSLCAQSPFSATREASTATNPGTTQEGSPGSPKPEKANMRQWRPSAAKNKRKKKE